MHPRDWRPDELAKLKQEWKRYPDLSARQRSVAVSDAVGRPPRGCRIKAQQLGLEASQVHFSAHTDKIKGLGNPAYQWRLKSNESAWGRKWAVVHAGRGY
jgi:hypothetical protein